MTAVPAAVDPAQAHRGRRAWSAFTTVLMWGVFIQAITAGRLLSGDDWARDAHRAGANLLILAAFVGSVVAFVRLRERAHGRRLAGLLLGLGVALFVMHTLGTMAAEGEDVLWLHIPLGVAIAGFTVRLNLFAREL